ncbi:MAG TPA: F0F1 ATP synthase subunit epsilon [Steroidobacteraceae bacterium]|nr:F0F1 ATP synthase subunit epsilon [Steroidobacteraceae bacterium]
MKLIVTTPLATLVEAEGVVHVRAEDATGAFGVLENHADFVTALSVSVLSWREPTGPEHHIAVRGGVLEVRGGHSILVATPEAVAGDDLHVLESAVLTRFRERLDAERAARVDAERLHIAAIRQIIALLRPNRARVASSPTLGPWRRAGEP